MVTDPSRSSTLRRSRCHSSAVAGASSVAASASATFPPRADRNRRAPSVCPGSERRNDDHVTFDDGRLRRMFRHDPEHRDRGGGQRGRNAQRDGPGQPPGAGRRVGAPREDRVADPLARQQAQGLRLRAAQAPNDLQRAVLLAAAGAGGEVGFQLQALGLRRRGHQRKRATSGPHARRSTP